MPLQFSKFAINLNKMGNDCFSSAQQARLKQKQQKITSGIDSEQNKRVIHNSQQQRSAGDNKQNLTATLDRQRSRTPNKVNRIEDLQKKRQMMIDKQRTHIKQKQESIKKVNDRIEYLMSSESKDDLKLAKFQRQVKVLQDCIRQHERNIQKIQKADSQIMAQ